MSFSFAFYFLGAKLALFVVILLFVKYNIAMTLKELRIQKEITQNEASKFLNIPLRSYKRYETDKSYEGTIKYKFLFESLLKYKNQIAKTKIVKKPNVVIAGIGYVGLSNGVLLAKKANVSFIDISQEKIKQINNKISPLRNKDFVNAVKNSNFKATDDIYSYKNADIVIVATPTNLDPSANTLDIFSVESVIRTVRQINSKCLIVIKSTVPAGFTKRMISTLDSNIIFCPEFLREEHAYEDVFYPSRLIIGADSQSKRIEKFENLLESSIKNGEKVIYMSTLEAETTKLFSNAYLAMRVAFFNELDSFALSNKISSENIIKGLGKDVRIGDIYNSPSFMFEGICLPKDTIELANEIKEIQNNQLITSITKSNENRLEFITREIIERAKEISGKNESDVVVGIYNLHTLKYGSGYKTSSSLRLMNNLKDRKIKVVTFDEHYEKSIKNFDEFVNASDIIVSNENHKELKKIKKKLFVRAI